MAREKYAQLAPLTLAIGSALAASSTQAAVITVDTLADPGGGGDCSLRSAISAVNSQGAVDGCPDPSGPDDDVIRFADGLSGTIQLNGNALEIAETVSITGPGSQQLSIDGQGNSSVFAVSGGNVEISGVTITNGAADDGGGVLAYTSGNLRLSDCVVANNSAVYSGGGVFLAGNGLEIDNCDITDNSSGKYGGGVAVYAGQARVRNALIAGNDATDIGGGLWVNGIDQSPVIKERARRRSSGDNVPDGPIPMATSLSIGDSLITDNAAALGGGVGAGRDQPVINRQEGDGSEPFGDGPIGDEPNLILQESVITGNTAENGGGIGLNSYRDMLFAAGGGISGNWVYNRVRITDSTVATNEAYEAGGGILSRSSDLYLYGSAVEENIAFTAGGGIYSVGVEIGLQGQPMSARGEGAPGVLYASDSSVSGNSVNGTILRGGQGPQGAGGGIASVFTPNFIFDTSIDDNNSAGQGGGLLVVGDSALLVNSQITGNLGGGATVYSSNFQAMSTHVGGNSGSEFGGVSCVYSPICDFKYSSVTDNTGFIVGGIAADLNEPGPVSTLRDSIRALGRGVPPPPDPSEVDVFNSTVSSNQGGSAGGIYADVLSLEHATVAFNQQVPGKLRRGVAGTGGVVTNQSDSLISHSIIAQNGVTSGIEDLRVTDDNIDMTYSLIGSDSGFTPVGSGNLLATDPLLQPLQFNGGSATLTHAIGTDSPAFDAGDPALNAPEHDQRGEGFPRTIGVIDIGAYEILIDGIFADRFEPTPP
jgi:hypothetical protein